MRDKNSDLKPDEKLVYRVLEWMERNLSAISRWVEAACTVKVDYGEKQEKD
jgi:hypothetical protein